VPFLPPSRSPRGFSLLVVLGVLLLLTAGAAGTLAYIGREATLGGNTRREYEAFFAAEAGLAEGRERVRLLAEGTAGFVSYTSMMGTTLPVAPAGIAAAGDTWYVVIPQTPYPLSRTGATPALDPTVTTPDREMTDLNGVALEAYPTAANVRYTVFLRDDVDENPSVPTSDTNAQVWLVSIGEVDIGDGQPVRRVTQALVNYRAGTQRVDCLGQRGGCSDKTSSTAIDVRTPDTSGGVRNLN
jgi:Tfp pilus assembly protein PilX